MQPASRHENNGCRGEGLKLGQISLAATQDSISETLVLHDLRLPEAGRKPVAQVDSVCLVCSGHGVCYTLKCKLQQQSSVKVSVGRSQASCCKVALRYTLQVQSKRIGRPVKPRAQLCLTRFVWPADAEYLVKAAVKVRHPVLHVCWKNLVEPTAIIMSSKIQFSHLSACLISFVDV